MKTITKIAQELRPGDKVTQVIISEPATVVSSWSENSVRLDYGNGMGNYTWDYKDDVLFDVSVPDEPRTYKMPDIPTEDVQLYKLLDNTGGYMYTTNATPLNSNGLGILFYKSTEWGTVTIPVQPKGETHVSLDVRLLAEGIVVDQHVPTPQRETIAYTLALVKTLSGIIKQDDFNTACAFLNCGNLPDIVTMRVIKNAINELTDKNPYKKYATQAYNNLFIMFPNLGDVACEL